MPRNKQNVFQFNCVIFQDREAYLNNKRERTAKVREKRKAALSKQAERLKKLNEKNRIEHTSKTINT